MSALFVRGGVLGLLGRFDEAAADYQAQAALVGKVGGDLGTTAARWRRSRGTWGWC